MSQDVFQAIADPTRREIFDILAGESMPVNDIAEKFDISRPAVSKHIKILNECGLIVIRKKGRKRYCRADVQKLQEVMAWLKRYQKFWDQKLDALEALMNDLNSPSNK
ncbi:MAG: transcriptional regulator [Balneola sp.]|jgi:DNA-binding transcriptional ArsR family regulator|nr:transcriptional regulator [Balneola sp.]MAL18913.1 transcriptional regulator [Balneola sp.]MBE78790.1 transcriptional regulator [Balneola sp.]HBX64963.1 transcriptional regulator [Balneolaceae bacterium]|tara:strand:- start:716 stop:1039 length:324 start_codon:yes stop_codon:yes gene_type:complete